MTNREVLAKFIRLAFNIEINDDFVIDCADVYCSHFTKCIECPARHSNRDFWDEEQNKVTALTSREISW